MNEHSSIIKLDEVVRTLAQLNSVDEVKAYRDKAEAMRIYAKQAKLGLESQNYAAEIKLRAERRAGELLREMEKHPAGRPTNNRLQPATDLPPTLSDLGIEKTESHRWQAIASIPEADFEQHLTDTKAAHDEVTSASALKLAKLIKRQGNAESGKATAQSLPIGVFNVIYADPPWQYDNNIQSWGTAAMHYSTMPLDDICVFPEKIDLQIADNAVLFMWVTAPFAYDAFQVITSWGFEYKTQMVWVKTDLEKPGSGFYVRGRHELLYICTRGSFTPLDKNISPPIGSVIEAPVQEHSRKPDKAYDIIEKLYPGCSYIELFARRTRDGWSSYGNELS